MKTIALLLANGFEEIEAITTIDMLRRVQIPVKTFSIDSSLQVIGAQQVTITADALLSEIDFKDLDGVILPGGLPGSTNLAASELVLSCLRQVYQQRGLIGAICAAPIALGKAGILEEHSYTCYPGCQNEITSGGHWTGQEIEESDNIITGRCPGASFVFGLALVKYFTNAATCVELTKGMIIQ